MSVCAVSGASGCKEGKRTSGSGLATQQQTTERQTVSSHTLRRGMPLEVSVAHSACLISVCISVCTSWLALYSPAPRTVKMWIIYLSLAESSRIREGMDVFFWRGKGGGSDEKGFYMK